MILLVRPISFVLIYRDWPAENQYTYIVYISAAIGRPINYLNTNKGDVKYYRPVPASACQNNRAYIRGNGYERSEARFRSPACAQRHGGYSHFHVEAN